MRLQGLRTITSCMRFQKHEKSQLCSPDGPSNLCMLPPGCIAGGKWGVPVQAQKASEEAPTHICAAFVGVVTQTR